jgi:hypothetical protein
MRTFTMTVPFENDGFEIVLPFDVKAAFGKARPPVLVTVNGFTFPSTVFSMGGVPMVPFRRSNRQAADVEVPGDLAEALGDLRPVFEAMSFTQRREWVESVLEANRPETRERRIASAVEAVRTRR